ncbi:hypothetical protein TNCV_2942711 [Trichonephila clavipes]|nr:hypothetical protein TNCV_2942711 [Trichonephila clavipes]
MYNAFTAWGTLNSRQATSPFLRIVSELGGPNHSQSVLSQNWGGKRAKSYCHLHDAQGYGQRQQYNLALCDDELRGPRFGTCQ